MRTHTRFLTAIALIAVLVTGTMPIATAPVAYAAPDAPLDTPTKIVSDQFNEWTISDGMMYWANRCFGGEFVGPGYLKRKPTAGGTTKTLSNTTAANCYTFLNMFANSAGVYYYSNDRNRFEFRPSGSPYDPATVIHTLGTGQRPPEETHLFASGDYLYWISVDDRIRRVKTDGTGLATVATTAANPKDLLVIGTTVYWLDSTGFWKISTSCGSLPCNATKEKVANAISGSHSLIYRPGATALTYAFYWAEGGDIVRVSCNTLSGACTKSTFYNGSWRMGGIAQSGDDIFWVEWLETTPPGGGFPSITDGRVRRQEVGATTAQIIATGMKDLFADIFTDANWVYFARYQSPNQGIYKLPVGASAFTWELQAVQWEVTQAIQNTANNAPLVARKPTYVRVYGRQNSGPDALGVQARLIGTRSGSPLPGSPLSPLDGVISMATGVGFNRANATDGWIFKLPDSWITAGTITLRAEVDPSGFYTDSNPANNALQGNFNFQNQPPVCVVTLPVWTNTPDPRLTDPNVSDMIQRFRRLWPVPDVWTYKVNARAEEVEVCWWGPFPYPCTGPLELEEDASVLNLLADRDDALMAIMAIDLFTDDPDACDNIGAPVHYMGMVHPSANTGSVAGYASLWFKSSWVKLPRARPIRSPTPGTRCSKAR